MKLMVTALFEKIPARDKPTANVYVPPFEKEPFIGNDHFGLLLKKIIFLLLSQS